ncbi:DUF2461 domain-containing protein [Bythopirellula goksoeyrii]|uniref:TIGR02453 family protein n=1 Tax=Bythopirellula goksoeyrii TaxID=1400387 RepID=A0A5B9Q7U8_9BACT|nr:DUF2461 domain-containing protein [Bythopirellula goksoeyrii]QEG35068.1 hypothetical protein Pr1d_23590 [Bythopirellula goksoeyrii]
MAKHSFQGFPADLVKFLGELSRHNNRTWFEANRQRYEDSVRGPALEFIAAMAGPLMKLSPHFAAIPKKAGGSLMRIHRDLRFSKDKKPYKTNLGIHFRHVAGKDVHAPGFYFHVDPREVFLGAGVWHPDSETLSNIREAIDDEQTAWKRVKGNKAFRAQFELGGESLKRPPRGYEADHPLLEDLKRKDHIALCSWDHEDLLQPTIVQDMIAVFRTTKPYMAFLCKAIGVKF